MARLNDSNLTLSIKDELKRLSEQMQNTFVEMQGEAKAVSQELKSLISKEIKIADAIEASSNALASANVQIERARDMLRRADLLLSIAELVRVAETAQLGQLTTKSMQIQQLGAEK